MQMLRLVVAFALTGTAMFATASRAEDAKVLSKPTLIWIDKTNTAHIISDGVEIGKAEHFTTGQAPGGAVGRPVDEDAVAKIPKKYLPYVRPQKDWGKYGIDTKSGMATIKRGAVALVREH